MNSPSILSETNKYVHLGVYANTRNEAEIAVKNWIESNCCPAQEYTLEQKNAPLNNMDYSRDSCLILYYDCEITKEPTCIETREIRLAMVTNA